MGGRRAEREVDMDPEKAQGERREVVLNVERATNCVMQFVDSWTKTCPFAGSASIYNTQSTRLVGPPICSDCISTSQSIDMLFFIQSKHSISRCLSVACRAILPSMTGYKAV